MFGVFSAGVLCCTRGKAMIFSTTRSVGVKARFPSSPDHVSCGGSENLASLLGVNDECPPCRNLIFAATVPMGTLSSLGPASPLRSARKSGFGNRIDAFCVFDGALDFLMLDFSLVKSWNRLGVTTPDSELVNRKGSAVRKCSQEQGRGPYQFLQTMIAIHRRRAHMHNRAHTGS